MSGLIGAAVAVGVASRVAQSAAPRKAAPRRRKARKAVHYHGVHACTEDHGRNYSEEGHRAAMGEAYGLEGGRYGLASQFVRVDD